MALSGEDKRLMKEFLIEILAGSDNGVPGRLLGFLDADDTADEDLLFDAITYGHDIHVTIDAPRGVYYSIVVQRSDDYFAFEVFEDTEYSEGVPQRRTLGINDIPQNVRDFFEAQLHIEGDVDGDSNNEEHALNNPEQVPNTPHLTPRGLNFGDQNEDQGPDQNIGAFLALAMQANNENLADEYESSSEEDESSSEEDESSSEEDESSSEEDESSSEDEDDLYYNDGADARYPNIAMNDDDFGDGADNNTQPVVFMPVQGGFNLNLLVMGNDNSDGDYM